MHRDHWQFASSFHGDCIFLIHMGFHSQQHPRSVRIVFINNSGTHRDGSGTLCRCKTEIKQKWAQDTISKSSVTNTVSLGLASKVKIQANLLLNVLVCYLVLGFAQRLR